VRVALGGSRVTQDTRPMRFVPVTQATKIGDCLPWHGSFDVDLVTPIDEDGNEVMPGLRSCGKRDCVNSNHVGRYLISYKHNLRRGNNNGNNRRIG
jgi:hypothetical protein